LVVTSIMRDKIVIISLTKPIRKKVCSLMSSEVKQNASLLGKKVAVKEELVVIFSFLSITTMNEGQIICSLLIFADSS
jgi:hypothetical protein